jgi:hypothetical protein
MKLPASRRDLLCTYWKNVVCGRSCAHRRKKVACAPLDKNTFAKATALLFIAALFSLLRSNKKYRYEPLRNTSDQWNRFAQTQSPLGTNETVDKLLIALSTPLYRSK